MQQMTWCWRWLLLRSIALTLILLAISNLISAAKVGAAQMDQRVLTTVEYSALLQRLEERLVAKPTDATLRSIQRELVAIVQVTSADDITIDLIPLLGTDAETLPTVEIAQMRLALVIHQMEAAVDDATAERLELLAGILTRPEFVEQDTLWQRFWRWLRSWLPDLPEQHTDGSPLLRTGLSLLGWIVIGIAAILLIYLLSIWLQRLIESFVGGEAAKRRLTAEGELLNAAEARQQAHQLAEVGSFRAAVRRLYLSALLALDEQGLLYYNRSNTNREVLATVRENPTLHDQLYQVVEIFDDVWYGVHEPDRTTFDRYVQAVEQLEGRTK